MMPYAETIDSQRWLGARKRINQLNESDDSHRLGYEWAREISVRLARKEIVRMGLNYRDAFRELSVGFAARYTGSDEDVRCWFCAGICHALKRYVEERTKKIYFGHLPELLSHSYIEEIRAECHVLYPKVSLDGLYFFRDTSDEEKRQNYYHRSALCSLLSEVCCPHCGGLNDIHFDYCPGV